MRRTDKHYFKKKKKRSPFDVNDLFPGYFKKNVFRGVVLVLVLFIFFVYVSNDFKISFKFISCAEDNLAPCSYEDELGDIRYIAPGEFVGHLPNAWARHYNKISLLLVALGFLFNHAYYFLRTGNFKVPVNKRKWFKITEALNEFNNKK